MSLVHRIAKTTGTWKVTDHNDEVAVMYAPCRSFLGTGGKEKKIILDG